MLNFSKAISFLEMGNVEASELLNGVRTFCALGNVMHQESLRTVVLKLIQYSRDLNLKQNQRDEAATMATHLANAAMKSYGQNSEYGRQLLSDIQIMMEKAA